LTVLGDALVVLHGLRAGFAAGRVASAIWLARAAAGHCSVPGYAATRCPHIAAGHAAPHHAPDSSTTHTHATAATAYATDEHESTTGTGNAGGGGTE